MKRLVIIVNTIVMFGILFLTGCSCNSNKENSNGISPQDEESSSFAGQIQTEIYENGETRIEFPKITGLEDEELQSSMNQILKEDALKSLKNYSSDTGKLIVQYTTSVWNDLFFTTIYQGEYTEKDYASPISVVYVSNIQLKKAERVHLYELADVRKVSTVLHSGMGYTVSGNGSSPFSNTDALMSYVTTVETSDLLHMLEKSDFSDADEFLSIFSYRKDDQVVLVFMLPHSLGDYAQYSIPFNSVV